MSKVFEVGKQYAPYAAEFGFILIKRRTEKTIWVDNGQTEWRMRIRRDNNGNEYAVDSCVPKKWMDAFTYQA